MKNTILKCLKRYDTLPFLFIGSGFSIRYLGLENWEGLLRKFAQMANHNEYAFEQYLQQAKLLGHKEGLYPKVAELIEKDFFNVWFTSDEYKESRDLYQEEIKKHTSPLKVEIARYMKNASVRDEYQMELAALSKIGKRSIAGILTTNYDCLLETIFDAYTRFIGQEELIFSPIQGIAEIYKIHGCCTKPESIVINESDYVDFEEKNAYLAAKILTLFLEHPVVFIGYSISDKNIENILKAIIRCLSVENLAKLKERLIFIEWNNSGEADDISTYSKSFEGGKSIEMTRIQLADYSLLYQALLENTAKYNAPMLRRLKEDIYELVLTNKPTGKIRTIGLEDERLEDVEVVIGVGVLAEFGQKGYEAITAAELYEDVVLDNKDFDPDLIVNKTLPMLLSGNSILPANKYLVQCTTGIPERVINSIKKDYDSLLNATIKKHRDKYRHLTLNDVIKRYSLKQSLCIIPHLPQDQIDVEVLHCFLKEIIQKNPNILVSDDINVKSDLKRLIRIFDWLKYYNKTKEPRI
jgi:hypothetical protein